MSLFAQSSPLLTKQGIAVSSKGENVLLQIGDTVITVPYEHAFALSKWMRDEAQTIKQGTTRAKTMRTLGIMHDASAKAQPLPHQAGTAIHVKPKLQRYQRSDVQRQGRMVLIKIGPHTISLHFESVLKIAQWIRVRAKEARNTAGDTRFWADITELNQQE